MAETAVTILIELLTPLIIEEVTLLKGAKKGVASIQQDLEMIRAFLRDADKRQLRDDTVKVWVKQVREEAYDIEDSVDEFLYQMGRPGWHTLYFRQLRSRHRISSKVRDHQCQLGKISDRAKSFSLPDAGGGGDEHRSRRGSNLTSLFVEESQVVGIENPREDLIRRLVTQESKPAVISVTGMAGVGKTTLVRKVSEDKRVKKHFECRAWVSVSKTFRLRKVLKTMIKQLKTQEQLMAREEKKLMVAGEDDARLVATMRKFLQKKRYLIVLDDIWTEDDWNTIKCAFPENGFQSSIIVTTRNTKVASYCSNPDDENVLKLEPLSKDEAWTLFCKKAFGAETGDGCPSELEETSRSIVEVCAGLPLAIVAIGGVLSTKTKNLSEWERVHRYLRSELEANQNLEPMKDILWLSYDDLPYHLKPCFLYFGIFPVDYTMKRSKITRLWIAEGFIKQMSNRSLEEVSESYLNELVQRNLVQAVKLDCFGRVHRCRVHDIMYELVVQKCREQNFHATWSQDGSGMDEKVRRLVLSSGQNLMDSPKLHRLRSLILLGSSEARLSPGFRNLKVLHLKKVPLQSFPAEILGLFHLTYLHLRKTNIRELPKSIRKLQNLQTLDLKRTPVSALPREIVELKNLRHILIYEQIFLGVEIPERMGSLTALQKLGHVNITGGADQLKELSKLSQLKRLCITKMGQGDGKDLCDSIRNMSQLESLYLYPGHDHELIDVESLPVASPFLRSINLRGQLQRLPDSILLFKSLAKLRLNFSKLKDDPFFILQHLPSLVELNMHNDAYCGKKLRTRSGGFLKLRRLHIHNFTILRLMVIEQGAMPNLDYLEFLSCEKLESVPAGIKHLINLKELYLGLVSEECMNKVRRDEGEDWEKVMHIPLIRKIYRENGQLYHKDI